MGGNFMLQGSVLYCMNAFMEPLCEVHGWTRAGLNLSMGFAALMGQLAMPLAAAVSARCSLRRLMALGALAGGAATAVMGLTGNILLYTLLFTIAWVCTQFCGGVVGNALMNNWFHHYRGRAFGLANAGTSLSGVALPFLSLVLIRHFDAGTAYLVLGLLTCALAPLAWFLVRDTPRAMHLHPDGRRREPRRPRRPPAEVSFSGMLHEPRAWFLGLAFGMALMAGSSIMSQMKPRFADLGLEAYPAMLLACAAALFAALVKYAWGWVCDRFTPLFAARLVMLCSAASLGLCFLPPGIWSMTAFSLSFGGCIGGLWTILPAVVSYFFGNGNFLPSYKFISIFIILRSAGFPVMGLSHDLTGSYAASDVIFGVSLLASLGLTLLLRESEAVESAARRHAAATPERVR